MRTLDELDWWLRRKLRCLLWRQWKTPKTRERRLISLGLRPERAWQSSVNGRGPWWNSASESGSTDVVLRQNGAGLVAQHCATTPVY
ncbi:hypothetical protein ACN1C3_16550 [Pseudomonas sp. H11T01]|uniref:hypothetical protein n=1 Tax=Pseudomonas sp. H11T01 TaxID=3402749 RepID=UPI003AD5818B